MPKLSIFFIKTAFAYLIIGHLLGFILLINKGFYLSPSIWNFLPLHIKIVFWGWLLQFIFGVAFCILPRFEDFEKSKRTWTSYIFINTSLILSIIIEILKINNFSSIYIKISLFLFVSHLFKRIRMIKFLFK